MKIFKPVHSLLDPLINVKLPIIFWLPLYAMKLGLLVALSPFAVVFCFGSIHMYICTYITTV